MKPDKCVIDFETFSECSLDDCGATVYAQHPSTEILCMSWRLTGMEHAEVWVPSRGPFPQAVIDHINDGGSIEAHNASFERGVFRFIMVPKFGIPWPTRWKDTMAVCAYRALPLGLAEVGEVLKLKVRKDTRGSFLISKLCVPQKPTKKHPEKRCSDPTLLEELYSYCGTDTDTEWELGEVLGELPPSEYAVWVLDQRINDRGVYVDIEAVEAGLSIIEEVDKNLTAELSKITDGVITTGGQIKRIVTWVKDRGLNLLNTQALTIERALEQDDLGPAVRRVLQIRQVLSHASVKKLYKFKSQRALDGRAHETLQYHGASTGRWAGRGIQLHNLVRGDEKLQSMATGSQDEAGIEEMIQAIKTRNLEYLDIVYGNPVDAVASALKGMITAAPGNILHVRDFSAIESVLTAWISEEQWKLDAFAQIFRGEKYNGADDIYCATAAFIFGHPVSKKTQPEERQDGKRCELAFGFQGGVGAWRRFDLRRPCDIGYKDDEIVNEYKKKWRSGHPHVEGAWFALENAAIDTVLTGKPHYFTKVYFDIVNDAVGRWLVAILPTGRKLWYLNPRVEVYTERFNGRLREKRDLYFWGKNSKAGGIWMEVPIYGGMWMENFAQSIARDVLVAAMIRCEKAGYPLILTIHDELIAETIKNFGPPKEFDRLIVEIPDWLAGCPIGAAGWDGFRYHKD